MSTRKSYRLSDTAVKKLDTLKDELTNMNETQIIHHAIASYYLAWHRQFPEVFPLESWELPN